MKDKEKDVETEKYFESASKFRWPIRCNESSYCKGKGFISGHLQRENKLGWLNGNNGWKLCKKQIQLK